MTMAGEPRWQCGFCGGDRDGSEVVQIRQCREESCATIFNGTGNGDACPECGHDSCLLTKRGCPDCLSEEPCEQVQDSVEDEHPDPPKAASADKSAKNHGGATNIEGKGRAGPLSFRHGTMRIDEIRIERPRRDLAEKLESLKKSIENVGLLQLPIVTEDHLLVAGRRRVPALKELGRTEIPVRIVKDEGDGLLLLMAERDENTERLPPSPLDAADLAERITAQIAIEAKKRQQQGGKQKGKVVGTSHQLGPKGKTRDLVAATAGYSARTLKKIEQVKQSGDPKLIDEMETTRKVDRVHKKLKRRKPPLGKRILQLDFNLRRLLPKIQGIVDEITAKKATVLPFSRGLAARLVEIGQLGALLQSEGKTVKQQPEIAKTANARPVP